MKTTRTGTSDVQKTREKKEKKSFVTAVYKIDWTSQFRSPVSINITLTVTLHKK